MGNGLHGAIGTPSRQEAANQNDEDVKPESRLLLGRTSKPMGVIMEPQYHGQDQRQGSEENRAAEGKKVSENGNVLE